jgi:F1F0 ATPase subunit 2
MTDLINLWIPFGLGALLGLIFFGGLWWTIREGAIRNKPAIWFLISLLMRSAIVVSGFYFTGQGQWERFLACLAGFLLARVVLTRVLKKVRYTISLTKERGYD